MSLIVSIGINNAAFKSGLNEMRGQAKAFSGEIKSMFASAFAAGAVVAGFAEWMRAMDRVKDLSMRFGESAETIQRVGLAAEQSGADIELVAKATSRLTIAAAGAAKGNEELAAKFADAGLNASEFIGLSMPEKLIALAAAYEAASGSALKQTAIMDLLGGRAQDLIPLLAQGPEALRAGMDAAIPASQAAVDSVDAFNDQMSVLKQNGAIVFAFLIQGVRSIALIIAAVVTGIWIPTEGLFRMVKSNISGLADAIKALARGDLGAAKDAIVGMNREAKAIMAEMSTASAGAAASIKDDWNAIWQGTSSESAPAKAAQDFEASAEAARDAAAAAEKLAAARQAVADVEQRNREAAMTEEERLNAMVERRTALLAMANDETEAGLAAKKEALELEGKIAEEQRRAAKAKADREKDAADKLAAAKEAEAAVDEQNKLAGMSKEERKAFFAEKQAKLMAEAAAASKSGDELTATQKRTEAKQLESELRADPAAAATAPAASPLKVVASSLASVGGGGNVAATDPLLREQQRATALLERIARATEDSPQNAPEQPPLMN